MIENIIKAKYLEPGMWVVERAYPDEEPMHIESVTYVSARGWGYYKVKAQDGFWLNCEKDDEFLLVDAPQEQRYQIRYYDMYSNAVSPIIDDIWAISEKDAIKKFCKENPNAVGVSATLW